MASESKVTLKSSDNELLEVSEPVASESLYIKNMIKMLPNANVISLPDVSGEILSKVIKYCEYHVETQNPTDEEIKTWDEEFVKVDTATLLDLLLAANYLHIQNLFDLVCKTMANRMKAMSVEEVRETFNIKNDFTPEEEEDVKRENQWAFQS